MICPQCGSDLGNHPGKYCIVCGAKIPTESVQAPSQPAAPKSTPAQHVAPSAPSYENCAASAPYQPAYTSSTPAQNTYTRNAPAQQPRTSDPAPQRSYSQSPSPVSPWPQWQLQKQISNGTDSMIYEASDHSGNRCIIKIHSVLLSRKPENLSVQNYYSDCVQSCERTLMQLQALRENRNIVTPDEYRVVKRSDGNGWDIYVRTPIMTPLSALDFGFDRIEPAVVKLGIDLCTGLEAASQRQILHGNIQPANIFIDDYDNYRLSDFGFPAVTSAYQAPELSQGHSVDVRSDLYSVGLVLYQLLNNGRLPNLQGHDYAYGQNLPQRLPAPRNASEQMAQFLNRACAPNPSNRFASPSQMRDALYQVMNGGYVHNASGTASRAASPASSAQVPNTSADSTDSASLPYTPYSLNSGNKAKSSSRLWILITCITALLCVIAVVAALLIRGGRNKNSDTIQLDRPQSQQEEITALPNLTVPPETTMPQASNCVGMHEYDASSYFREFGCTVICEYEHSDSVAEGYVISQSIPEGTAISAGQNVTLLVSLGKDECPYDYTQKVVVSAAPGSSYGTLELFQWENGDWVSKFECDATLGSKGISSDYGEGKKRTPEGIFKLGVALSANSISNEDWPFQRVSSDTCIVDDTDSGYYNTIQSISALPRGVHYDPIGKTIVQGYSNICIYIEHNGDGLTSDNVVAGKGSVITICGRSGSIKPTLGCVDISSSNMNTLISLLDYTQNPHIEITTE